MKRGVRGTNRYYRQDLGHAACEKSVCMIITALATLCATLSVPRKSWKAFEWDAKCSFNVACNYMNRMET